MLAARRVLGVSAISALLVVCAPSAFAATPDTPYDVTRVAAFDPQPTGRFGDRMASAGDLNGDGVGDFWSGDYGLDVGNLVNAGRVYAVSGKDRSRLYQIDSPEPQSSTAPFAGFGWYISNLGDVDGDGVNDVAAGSIRHNVYTGSGPACGQPEPNGCNEGQGRAWVFSGAKGTLLYTLDNPRPQEGGAFGWVSNAGDVVKADGSPGQDGISELVVGAFQNDYPSAGCGNATPVVAPCRKDQGQLFIFNGAPGLSAAQRFVRTLDVPTEDLYYDANGVCTSPNPGPTTQRCGGLGIVVQGTGDTNGDGFADQLGSAWTTGITNPGGQPCLGTSPEVNDACNERQGRMYLYSGKDGTVLKTFDDPVPQQGALFGLQIVDAGAPGDVTGDKNADIYGAGFQQAGPSRNGAAPLPNEGRAWVFDGKTGGLRYELLDPTPEVSGTFGYALARTDDDKDGRPDLYVGSFSGSYVFRGSDGALLHNFDLPPGNTNLGRSVAAPGDLNGDGEPDYVAGAPGFDVGSNVDEGRLYAFLSRVPPVTPPDMNRPGVPPGTTPPGVPPGATPSGVPPLIPPSVTPRDTVAPAVTGYGVTSRRFTTGRASTPLVGTAAAVKLKVGTAFRYTLSEAATVRISIVQRTSGRRRGTSCVAPSRKLRAAKRCTRLIVTGTLVRASRGGANRVAFTGRIGAKALKPGSFRASLTAADAAGNRSAVKTVSFTVAKR